MSDAAALLLEAFRGSVLLPTPDEIPGLFRGPFGVCAQCHRGAYVWMLVGDDPVPIHRRCVEAWVMAEGSDGEVSVGASAAPVGVYAKWAERSGK